MNWDAIGALAELLGSIAVLSTLVYLSIQVRSARDEVRRSIRSNRTDIYRQMSFQQAGMPELNDAMVKAISILGENRNPFKLALMKSGMTDAETSALLGQQWAWWGYYSQVISDIDHLEDNERTEFNRSLPYHRQPVFKLFFECMQGSLDPKVVSYIEDLQDDGT